jgi:hypothetical protein
MATAILETLALQIRAVAQVEMLNMDQHQAEVEETFLNGQILTQQNEDLEIC